MSAPSPSPAAVPTRPLTDDERTDIANAIEDVILTLRARYALAVRWDRVTDIADDATNVLERYGVFAAKGS